MIEVKNGDADFCIPFLFHINTIYNYRTNQIYNNPRNLMNQTSCKFRMKYKLPDVCSIANQKQKIRIVRNLNQKEMGEKYNPYALIIPNKNRTARNYIGDLFKH